MLRQSINCLLSVVKNIVDSSIDLDNVLKKITEWAFQYKIHVSPNLSEQAQEVFFSRKVQIIRQTLFFFNQNTLELTSRQK